MDNKQLEALLDEAIAEGANEQQLRELHATLTAPQQPVLQQPQNIKVGQETPSFLQRLGEDWKTREGQVQQSLADYQAGKKTLPEQGWQAWGSGLDIANDVVREGLTSAVGGIKSITPDPVLGTLGRIKDTMSQSWPFNTELATSLKDKAKSAGQAVQSFNAEHPRLAENLKPVGSALEFFTNTPIALKGTQLVGREALGAAGNVAEKALTKQIIPNADKIRELASGFYKQAEDLGGVFDEGVSTKLAESAGKISSELVPKAGEGKVGAALSNISSKVYGNKTSDILDEISNISGEKLSLSQAEKLDELLGDAIDSFVDRQTGKLEKQGKKLYDLQSDLRNLLDESAAANVGSQEGLEAWKTAKSLWSDSRRLGDVERIIQRAELTQNPATAIKSGFSALYNNKSRLRGFSTAEQQMIKHAASTGQVTDLLRTFGSRLIPTITMATGGGLGGTAAATAASLASRTGANALQVGRAQKLADFMALNAANKAGIPTRVPRFSLVPKE